MANATTVIQTEFRNMNMAMSRKATVATGVTIYEGTLVSLNASGEAIVAITTSRIAGVALKEAAAGEVVNLWIGPLEIKLAMSGAAATDVGVLAYAADNQTATTTPNTAILGPIVDVETDIVWVALSTGLF